MFDELNETTAVSLKVQYFTNMVLFQIGSDIQRRAQKFEDCPFSRLLFSETAGNSLTRVNTFQGVTDLSIMISQSIHDQVCFYDWRRNISPAKCTACQKIDISRHLETSKMTFWNFRETRLNVGHLRQRAWFVRRFATQFQSRSEFQSSKKPQFTSR